jgi:hypothetical protein
MPTAENDFLPFATGAGANVLTTEEWNALAAVGSGFQSGILPSTNLNKALRQSSFVACAMAQIIAGQDVAATDDGNVANFVTNFLAALVTALGTVASFTNPGYYPAGRLRDPVGQCHDHSACQHKPGPYFPA